MLCELYSRCDVQNKNKNWITRSLFAKSRVWNRRCFNILSKKKKNVEITMNPSESCDVCCLVEKSSCRIWKKMHEIRTGRAQNKEVRKLKFTLTSHDVRITDYHYVSSVTIVLRYCNTLTIAYHLLPIAYPMWPVVLLLFAVFLPAL